MIERPRAFPDFVMFNKVVLAGGFEHALGASADLGSGLMGAGQGLTGRPAGIKIIEAVLTHFRAEITVLNHGGDEELFRVGTGSPRHGIHGIHIHPVSVHSQTFQMQAHKDAVELMADQDFNMYLGLLIQALEVGRYRAGFKK